MASKWISDSDVPDGTWQSMVQISVQQRVPILFQSIHTPCFNPKMFKAQLVTQETAPMPKMLVETVGINVHHQHLHDQFFPEIGVGAQWAQHHAIHFHHHLISENKLHNLFKLSTAEMSGSQGC